MVRETEEGGGIEMGQCVWLLKGSPAGWGRGTGQPSGGSRSTLTRPSLITKAVAQGSH